MVAEPCLHSQHVRAEASGWAPATPASVTVSLKSDLPTRSLETLTGLNLLSQTDQPASLERESGRLPQLWEPGTTAQVNPGGCGVGKQHRNQETQSHTVPAQGHRPPSPLLVSNPHPTPFFFSLFIGQAERDPDPQKTPAHLLRVQVNTTFTFLAGPLTCALPPPQPCSQHIRYLSMGSTMPIVGSNCLLITPTNPTVVS